MSWVNIDKDSPFSLENIPFGIVSTGNDPTPRPATIVGDTVLDLKAFSAGGGFKELDIDTKVFDQPTLNAFAALGRPAHRLVRAYLQEVFSLGGKYESKLETNAGLLQAALVNVSEVKSHMPMAIGDYTDFYVGLNHAYNCGVMFRGPENALQPNYYHLPVGYHGRASSVVVSGTDLHRPCGQILPDPAVKTPAFAACKKLDYELEFAAFISTPNQLGSRIDVNKAEDHIFGYVLMNDWSARDVQGWEYVPLGPFTAKNFGTSITPWVVLHDALVPFRCGPMSRPDDKPVLPYLVEKEPKPIFDLELEVEIETDSGENKQVVSNGSTQNLLFSFPQMIAHHTVTGCNMQTGDLIASGTISGTEPGTLGSLIEMTNSGKQKITIGSTQRTFLEDGDRVTMRAIAGAAGKRVGFGPVTGKILPAAP